MKRHRCALGSRAWQWLGSVGLAAVAAIALGACGSGEGSSAGTGVSGGQASAAAGTAAGGGGGCGSIPAQLPQDPDGVLAKLPKKLQEGYIGYPQPVYASPWRNWKPKGKPPYTVGLELSNTQTALTQIYAPRFKAFAKDSHLVGDVVVGVANNNVQTDLQQVRTMIRQGVDIIVWLVLSPQAAKPVIDEAAKAGIPVVTPLGPAPTPNAVGVTPNLFLAGALTSQAMAKDMDDKGQVLQVHAIPSTITDSEVFRGEKAVFDRCPDIKMVGDLVGQFVPAVAKAQTLQYLSANTQPIGGVMQPAGMAPGIIQAFQQAGRPTPTVADIAAIQASLAYWRDHKDSYKGVGVGEGVEHTVDSSWGVAERMLEGRGVTVSDIVQRPPLITADNLDEWVKPDWTEQSVGAAEGPPGTLFSDSFLDAFFVKPGPAQQGQ